MIIIKPQNLPRVNEQIDNSAQCLLIDSNGEKRGIMTVNDARELASEQGLDLVEVSTKSHPATCKIMNYSKYLYNQQKKKKANKKSKSQRETKEIRFNINIGDNDRKTKIKQAKKFLEKGNKVQISIMFKGRQSSHSELGVDLLEQILYELEENYSIAKQPSMNGKTISIILAPA